VSHDRFFISRTANKIVELVDGDLKVYNGDYQYYLEKKEEEKLNQTAALKKAEQDQKEAEKRAKQKEKEAERKGKKKQKLSV
jgi:ATP-binding cassette subfamily F protein 3